MSSEQAIDQLEWMSGQPNQNDSDSFLGYSPVLADQFREGFPRQQIPFLTTRISKESSVPETYEQPRETQFQEEVGISPPAILPEAPPVRDRFSALQMWEGVVLEVTEDSFFARLVDLTKEGPDEEAEFPIEEVSEEDRKFVEPGAVFYWTIGYHDSRTGQRTRASIIRFRRLPAWTKRTLEAAKSEAGEIRDLIGWK